MMRAIMLRMIMIHTIMLRTISIRTIFISVLIIRLYVRLWAMRVLMTGLRPRGSAMLWPVWRIRAVRDDGTAVGISRVCGAYVQSGAMDGGRGGSVAHVHVGGGVGEGVASRMRACMRLWAVRPWP